MDKNERYIKVGNIRVVVDIELYREFNKLKKQQYDKDKSFYEKTQVLREEYTEDKHLLDINEALIGSILIEKLNEAINRLTVEEQYIIHELFYCGVSERVLAKDMGISQQAVNKKKRQILDKLKSLINF